MPNFVYTSALQRILNGTLDLDSSDLRALLVDSSTTADTERDVTTIAGFTTLGELSGTGYSRKALTTEAVSVDNANDRAAFDADDVTWTGIDAGTAAAVVIYKHVTNDSDSIPLLFLDNKFVVTSAAAHGSGVTTLYVDPLPGAIANGASLTFGAVTVTLTAAASRGDRTLTVSSTSGSIAANVTATSPASQFPVTTNGGDLTLQWNALGILLARNPVNN